MSERRGNPLPYEERRGNHLDNLEREGEVIKSVLQRLLSLMEQKITDPYSETTRRHISNSLQGLRDDLDSIYPKRKGNPRP